MANFPSCSHHAIGKEVRPPKNFSSVGIHRSRSEFRALGLVLIISPSSDLGIMHRFFLWTLYSSRNILSKFQFFFSIGSTSSQSFSSIGIHRSRSEFGALGIVLIISPSPESESHIVFFMDFLFFKEHFVKISNFFSTSSIGSQSFSLGRLH